MSVESHFKSPDSKVHITLSCISPEARALLEDLCKKYEEANGRNPVDVKESAYSTLYWAVRYSNLIVSKKHLSQTVEGLLILIKDHPKVEGHELWSQRLCEEAKRLEELLK